MNPMVFMILKWEKELEHPNRPLIQWQIFKRLLTTKEDNPPGRKSIKSISSQKQCDCADRVEYQTCNELA